MSPGVHARGRVLVVDDDEHVARAYTAALRNAGHGVEWSSSGESAIDKLAQAAPLGAVLLDVHLPGISGLEFLRRLRARDDAVAVVMLTGDPQLSSAAGAVEQGAFRYLLKPLHPELLVKVIKSATEATGRARQRNDALAIVVANQGKKDERALLELRFERALQHLFMAYQPIIDLSTSDTIGHEALVRSKEAGLNDPHQLFHAAEELGRTAEIGRYVRQLVARRASSFREEELLFVNLHSAELMDLDLLSPESPLSEVASRVVLEITERHAAIGIRDLQQRVARLRAMGFRVAVDDMGVGYSGLTTLSDLYPDYAKIDVSLVRDIADSPLKRSVVRSLFSVCTRDLGMKVIAEGVETEAERDCLWELGCTLMQGHLFARPSELPPP